MRGKLTEGMGEEHDRFIEKEVLEEAHEDGAPELASPSTSSGHCPRRSQPCMPYALAGRVVLLLSGLWLALLST